MAGAPPVSAGPRLGKLQGLRREEDDDPQQKQRRPGKKGGIKILPLILMFVMFGPVVLTGLIFAFDYVATSEWGVKVGLSDDPRTRLTKFYKKHNPTKMRDVDRLLVKYKGKYAEMFKKLEAKYGGSDSRRKKQTEEEEEYVREQERYEREAREAQDKF